MYDYNKITVEIFHDYYLKILYGNMMEVEMG